MGVAATTAPKGLGPQTPSKKLGSFWVILGHLLSPNCVPKLSDPGKYYKAGQCLVLCDKGGPPFDWKCKVLKQINDYYGLKF